MRPWFLLLLLTLLLSGCGQSNLNDSDADSKPISDHVGASTILTGRFLDSAVEGITYTSGSTTGTTHSSGTFQYENGNTVSFSVGDVVIGSGTPAEVMTAVDLVSEGNTDSVEVKI